MKKNLYFSIALFLTQNILAQFEDFKTGQAAAAAGGTGVKSTSQTSDNSVPAAVSCSSCCPASDETTAPVLPPITIAIQDATNTVLYATTIMPGSNFTVSNAILSVSIFPPSSTKATSNSYYIVCNLTSLQGTAVQKKIQPTPTPGIAQSAPKMFPTIPTSISIYSGITADSNGKVTIPAGTQALATSNFFPSGVTYTPAQQQQILNLISPLSQEFLIQQASSTLSASSSFGTLQTASATTTITVPSATATTGGTPSAIGITITDGNNAQTLTFSNPSFNAGDLLTGLLVTTHIFPPTTSPAGTYLIISTIKTLDGLKLQKQVLTGVSFTALPSCAAISYDSQTVLSYNFVDTSLTSQATFNMKNPIIVKMLLRQDSSRNPFALML